MYPWGTVAGLRARQAANWGARVRPPVGNEAAGHRVTDFLFACVLGVVIVLAWAVVLRRNTNLRRYGNGVPVLIAILFAVVYFVVRHLLREA